MLCKLLAVKEISPVPHRVYKIVELQDGGSAGTRKTRLPWWSHWWRPVCALLHSPCPLGGLRVGAGVGGAKIKRLVEAVSQATPLL